MESNECVCINYFVKMIEGMINSLISTTSTVRMNTNTPATDSGYTTSFNTNNSPLANSHQSLGGDLLNTGFYTIVIIIALSLILMGLNKLKNKSSTLSK